MRDGILNERDHYNLDGWLFGALRRLRLGQMTEQEFVGTLGQVFGALDIGNLGEVREWLSGRNDPAPT